MLAFDLRHLNHSDYSSVFSATRLQPHKRHTCINTNKHANKGFDSFSIKYPSRTTTCIDDDLCSALDLLGILRCLANAAPNYAQVILRSIASGKFRRRPSRLVYTISCLCTWLSFRDVVLLSLSFTIMRMSHRARCRRAWYIHSWLS